MEAKSKEHYLFSYLPNDVKPQWAGDDKEDHYMLVKGIIQQEDLVAVKIYTLNLRDANFVEKRETNFLKLRDRWTPV